MSLESKKPIQIRNVWSHNLVYEVKLLSTLIDRYTYVSMDTEFPGLIFKNSTDSSRRRRPPPKDHYQTLKSNVDALNLIQLGLTLADAAGNLPDLGSENRFIWQFNFSDFDLDRDRHEPASIDLLRDNGIDFDQNRANGVDSVRFAEQIMSSGLILNEEVTWVTFQGGYDFGYLLKVITRRELPPELSKFVDLVRVFFGRNVYDVRYLMDFCNPLYGGLDKVAGLLNVARAAGKSHQAGSDSLLTWHVFDKMRARFFTQNKYHEHSGVLFGLNMMC